MTKKVCHLVYDLIRGGTEGQCARTAMALTEAGEHHTVAAFHRRGFFLPQVEATCGPVYELPIRHFLRPATLQAIHAFAAYLRRGNVQILHTWDADAAIFGAPAASLARIPLITSRRDLGEIYPPHKTFLLRCADRQACRIVTNAEQIRTTFIARGVPAEKLILIPNLLDLDAFDAAAARPFTRAAELPPGRRTICVGRLDPEKNVAALLHAFPLVLKKCPDAKLIIAGDGRERNPLEALAREKQVEQAVYFLGDTPEIPSLLQHAANAVLLPKCNEGQSNAILEYLAASLPVLATDCGGNKELLAGMPGAILIPPTASSPEIADAWIRLFEAQATPAIREILARRHARAAVLPLFQQLYSQI